MLETLKPCPFCGNPGQLDHDSELTWVTCENSCDIQTFPEGDDAVSHWNARPIESDLVPSKEKE